MADVTLPLFIDDRKLAIPQATATQDGYVSKEWFILFSGGAAVPVTSWNFRTGEVHLLEDDVLAALGYVPQASLGYTPLNKAGDTMTGALQLAGPPAADLHAATRLYVDTRPSAVLPGNYLASSFNASGSALKFTGSISATSKTLTISGTDFQVGQGIYIAGAGSGGPLVTKVDAISGTTITLHDAAATTVSAVANNVQHDDTVAIQTALNTVLGAGGGTLQFGPGFYRVNGPVQTSTNSILTIPYIPVDSTHAHKAIALVALVPQPISAFLGPPSTTGVVIQSDRIGTNFESSIFAVTLYDASSAVNTPNATAVYMDGITWRTYDQPQINALDLAMCVNCSLRNVLIDTGMNMLATSEPIHGSFGLRLARNNVTYGQYTESVFVIGYGTGIIFTEEWNAINTAVLRCSVGMYALFGYHPSYGRILIWQCASGLQFGDRMCVDFSLDFEKADPGHWYSPGGVAGTLGRDVVDTANKAMGSITYSATTSYPLAGDPVQISITNCAKILFFNMNGLGSPS